VFRSGTAHDLYRFTKISMCAQGLGCFEIKIPHGLARHVGVPGTKEGG
jgi:hypothetical protein